MFGRPKCPKHGVKYSIGSGVLMDYYYCPVCQSELKAERLEEEYELRLKALEDKINNNTK